MCDLSSQYFSLISEMNEASGFVTEKTQVSQRFYGSCHCRETTTEFLCEICHSYAFRILARQSENSF